MKTIKKTIATFIVATMLSVSLQAQSTQANNNFLAANYLGWATSNDLPFKLNGTQYLTLKSTGDLNLNTSTNAFQINGNNMLWNYGNTADLFVGYGAGNATMTNHNNTFIGYNVGGANTGGLENTAVGYSAATNSLLTSQGTYVGAYAGQNSYNGHYPTFIGYKTGISNQGDGNVFVGYESGITNVGGSSNTFVGANTGVTNSTGGDITLIGYGANVGSSGLTNAAAIGSGASVTTGSTMILGDNNTSVGIGYSGSTITSQTKFDVLYSTGSAFTSGPVYGGHFINSNTVSGSTNPYVYGVYGEASGTETYTTAYHYGAYFNPKNAYHCIGVAGVATNNNYSSGSSYAYGGYFNANIPHNSNTVAYGVYATVGSGANANYALYATVSSYSAGNYAGYFNGDVYTTGGSNSGTGYLVASDQQFKTNINAVSNPSVILNKLKPRTYYYDTTANNGMHFSGKKQYGFIAQELQQVLPELVYNVTKPADLDSAGNVKYAAISHLAVNYDGFIALTIAGMQVQQSKIDSLITKTTKQDSINQALQNQINQLAGIGARTIQNNPAIGGGANPANATSIGSIDVQLSNADVAVLNPNAPNPFAEQTLISYNIPQNANSAQILFYDLNGKQIKSVNITTKGAGQLNVYANDLTNGTYSYTLVIDGQIFATQKMIKQQ